MQSTKGYTTAGVVSSCFFYKEVTMKINGKTLTLNGPQPLRRVLIDAGFDPEAVALEKNEKLIRRIDFDETTVDDEDVLEVFSFTGGG